MNISTDTPENSPEISVCGQELDEIILKHGHEPGGLIAVLQAIQDRFNYLPEPALIRTAELLRLDLATILGVVTFYRQFRLNPAGKHTIRVCVGTACHVKGANQVYDQIRDGLNIPENGDTDKEGLFTVEKVACIGCCMLAPAVQIDEVTNGPVQALKAGALVKDFLADRETESQRNGHFARNGNPGVLQSGGEIRICRCSSCSAAGSNGIYEAFKQAIHAYAFPVRLKNVGCNGSSWEAPLVELFTAEKTEYRYGRVKMTQVNDILRRHFKPAGLLYQGKVLVSSLLEGVLLPQENRIMENENGEASGDHSIRFFGPQKPIVTEHQGLHDPLDFDEYEKQGGFLAWRNCLALEDPREIIRIIEASGLRGRGGGGFPTARKWAMLAASEEPVKYLICNGDEGDPGAFMDRMILESFPFRVIEGMAIAAHAVGARESFAYVRAEYGLAIRRLEKALEICRQRGILADEEQDNSHSMTLHLVKGAGAFVCGEETALIQSIEGKRGMPQIRPPYPVEKGLWGKPTLVNNVETFASVPWILQHGASAFSSLGTESSKGTKTFALAGKINRSGLIEVPMGVSLRQIIEDIGGGIPRGKKLKAVQIGGPSGGCIPASLCDLPIDYEALRTSGAIMGSGGLVVLDEDDCMVDLARYFMNFIQDESCGKCTFCRIGTRRMLEILERICAGQGKPGDLEKLESLGRDIKSNSLCGLGKTAPNPVLSTLQHFREEYEAHLQGRCPAGKCRELIHYRITGQCIGCTLCVQHCPTGAIPFTPYQIHSIADDLCTRCDACRQVCPTEGAVIIQQEGLQDDEDF